MDDFNNKLENENQTAENKAAETQTPAAEPQAQQPNETAPQQTETPQAQQKSGEELRTPFQTPVQHPEQRTAIPVLPAAADSADTAAAERHSVQ